GGKTRESAAISRPAWPSSWLPASPGPMPIMQCKFTAVTVLRSNFPSPASFATRAFSAFSKARRRFRRRSLRAGCSQRATESALRRLLHGRRSEKAPTASPTSEASHAKDQNSAGRLGDRLRRQEGPGVGEPRGREVSQSQDQGSSRTSRPEDARAGNRCARPCLQLGGKRTQLNGADRLARSGGRQVSAQARRAPQRGSEVAPPRALGVLRHTYSHNLRAAVRAEIDKDLVRLPLHEIEEHLAR